MLAIFQLQTIQAKELEGLVSTNFVSNFERPVLSQTGGVANQ